MLTLSVLILHFFIDCLKCSQDVHRKLNGRASQSMGRWGMDRPRCLSSKGHFVYTVAILMMMMIIIIIIIISFATDCVLAVVVAVNSSVRRVITNDHRLTECSFL